MAKAKKRVAPRKKTSKRGKESSKPWRHKAAKHATPKKAKSKVQRAGMSAKKPAAKKKRPPETVETGQVAAKPIETTIIDAIKEPAPGLVAVTEYETVHTAASLSTGAESERGEGIGPVSTST